jgi:WD40 repeat protein
MNKLYGHPHEISALAKCNRRKLLASSCYGKNKVFCAIIIWSIDNWKIKNIIEHHHYTVHAMEFSECGQYFASVSKDRNLAVFNESFELLFSC